MTKEQHVEDCRCSDRAGFDPRCLALRHAPPSSNDQASQYLRMLANDSVHWNPIELHKAADLLDGKASEAPCTSAPSKRMSMEAEDGIRSRHSHVEQSENKIGATEAMSYLSHLDRGELLAEVACLRYLLNGARAYVCSFAQLTRHPTARADAMKLVERIDGLRQDETIAPHGPMSVYRDHLENRQSPLPDCDCTACQNRRRSPEEPPVLGAGAGPAPMPTALEAIEAHVRQIQILCDATGRDPAEWLTSPEEPTPCPECVAVRKLGLLSCHKHLPEKASGGPANDFGDLGPKKRLVNYACGCSFWRDEAEFDGRCETHQRSAVNGGCLNGNNA